MQYTEQLYSTSAPVYSTSTPAVIRLKPVEWPEETAFAVEVRRVETAPSARAIPNEAMVLNWSASFLTIAVLAALFGFGGNAGRLAPIAQLLCAIFSVLFVGGLIIARRQILRTRQT